MSGEPLVTLVGTAGGEAQLRYTASGAAVCSWSMAVTPRVKQGDGWVDGDTTWYRCSAWRQLGESAAESIVKGMRLVVHGRLRVRIYDKDGVQRTSVEVDVEHVGADMRYATVTAQKAQRSSGQGQQSGGSDDPWNAGPASQPIADEAPPF